jgi:hypothetical protein
MKILSMIIRSGVKLVQAALGEGVLDIRLAVKDAPPS